VPTIFVHGFENHQMNTGDDETVSLNGESPSARPNGNESPNAKPIIGDYELLDVVAHGGMGVVYRARQVSLNRIVAIKMIRQFEFASEADRIRFGAEAEAAAALNHPNTVPIYEVGEHDGQPYFSMRLIEGGSLAKGMAAGDWPINNQETIRKAVRLIHLVALAVHDAHQRGIIHRDLKPGNILVDEVGVPFVADFGLAKRHSNRDQVTQTGSIVGTPAFMSPEQAVGKEITISTDIYSLGAILYNLLGGRPPIQADTPMELFKELMENPAAPVRKWNRMVDKDIETVCQKCLEKEPARRYTSARALADDLQDWLDGKPISARPIGPITRLYRWSKRNPMNVVVSGLAFALGLVILGTLALGYLSTKNAIDGFQRERYANRIAQAAAAFNDGSPMDAESYLSKELPGPNQQDLRGWEWYYLKRKSAVEYQLEHSYWNASWSPEGKHFALVTTDLRNFQKRTISAWRYPVDDPNAESHLDSLLSEPAFFTSSTQIASGSPNLSRMAWDPNGRFLATIMQGDGVRIWDTEAQIQHSFIDWSTHFASVSESPMQWSHDGMQLAVISTSGNLKLHLMESKKTIDGPRVSLEEKGSVVTGIEWGPDDSWLAIAESKRTQFINTKTHEVAAIWPISIVAWNHDHSRWFCEQGIGDSDSAEIRVAVSLNRASVWSPDGRWIASANGDRVFVVDTNNGKTVQEYSIRNAIGPIWFPSSDRLLVSGRVLRNLGWSAKDSEITLDNPITVVESSRDGSIVAIANQNSSHIQVLDSRGNIQSTFNGHASPVVAIDWRHDDQRIASLDTDGKVRVWDVYNGGQVQVFSLFDEGNNSKQINQADWQVHWSPDDNQLAACAAGTNIQVWEPESGAIQGQLTKKNARILGWTVNPISLNIQIYNSNSLVFPRQRNTAYLETANVSRIINWDIKNNTTHTFSTGTVANNSKAACAWPDDNYYYTVNAFGDGLVRETLDSPSRNRSSLSYSSASLSNGTLSQIELAEPPSRVFSLSTTGTLELNDVERKTTLLRLPKCSKDSLLSYSPGMLWVAEGKKLRLFDATSTQLGKVRRQVKGPNFSNEVLNQLVVLVLLAVLIVAPIWIAVDTGIQMTLSRRWIITTCVAASAAVLISQINMVGQTNWGSTQTRTLMIPAFAIAAGNSAFLVESLRLATHGRWVIPLLLWLCILLGALLLLGYFIWPSAWQLEQEAGLYSISWVILPTGFATFVIGAMMFASRFTTGAYAASFRFQAAPYWVKWSLWGCKSARFAIIQTPFELLFYCAIFWAGLVMPPPLKWLLVAIGFVSIPLPIVRLFAVRWLRRNGGWDAQL
jgi:serine/threonine protein kinase/lipid-A-disaccharide synthase-like uncharacterized protein